MRAAFVLFKHALYRIGFALALVKDIENKLHFRGVATVIYYVRLYFAALYIAVQRKVDTVQNGAFSAARIPENSENSRFGQSLEVYYCMLRKAVYAFKFKS